MTGEDNTIDFNFEELEFINSLEEVNEEPINDPNTPEEEETTEGEGAGLETAEAQTQEEVEDNKIDNEDTIDAEGLERVDSGSTDEESGKETSPQLFQAFAETLKESGILSSVDESSLEGVKGEDDLVELIKKQIAAQELSDLDDTQKAIVKDLREGVSTDTATQYKKAMDQLHSISDDMIKDDQQVRFDLIYQDFVSKGFTKERATKFANQSFKSGEDLVDAAEAKRNLIGVVEEQYEQTKEREIKAAKEEKAKIKAREIELKDKILKTEEIAKGLTIPENVRKEVYKEMSTTVSTNPTTGIPENALQKYQRENPTEFGHKLYFLWKVTKGFEDYSYFANKRGSKKARKLETALRQSAHVSGGGDPSFTDDGDSHLLDIGSADDIVVPGQ